MPIVVPPGATTYQLIIELACPVRIQVGRLGIADFPAGTFVYTGSARRAVEARVRRHLTGARRLHWHIDYLLACGHARVTEVRISSEPECLLNQRTNGQIVLRGFGASDCRAGCGAHLKRIG
ncbi:MAG: GIY-YIG nuclease family protein [Candidatus Methylophosphatis roskildensis]